MSFLSSNSSFEAYKQDWNSQHGLGLVEQICNASHFLSRLRVQLRYGELSRAPITLLRLQLIGDTLECDWLARQPDPWDFDLPKHIRMRHASLQTLRDAMDVRSILFRAFPAVDSANLKIYRSGPTGQQELIVTGCAQRNDNSSRWIHSLVVRARNLGFRFRLENETLSTMPEPERETTKLELQLS